MLRFFEMMLGSQDVLKYGRHQITSVTRVRCPGEEVLLTHAPQKPPTTGSFFTTEAEVQEATNIRKPSPSRALRSPGVSPCSHTAICPEPAVRQGEIHLGTAGLL